MARARKARAGAYERKELFSKNLNGRVLKVEEVIDPNGRIFYSGNFAFTASDIGMVEWIKSLGDLEINPFGEESKAF